MTMKAIKLLANRADARFGALRNTGSGSALKGVICAAVLVIGALSGISATGQTYPSKPIRLIIPFTPGGSTDILGRVIGQSLTEAWGQQVLLENRAGAGGAIGAEAAARAAPDGYTLFMGHVGTLAVNPALYPKLPYDPIKDFAPITLIAMVTNVLVVNPDVPAKTVQELIALARSKPGQLNYGSGGQGSAAHLAMEYFKLMTKTDIVHIPYKGTVPAVTDLLAGRIALTMTGLPPLLPQIKAGKIRALAVATAKRVSQLPNVPTVAESGVPGFEATQWYGLLAPAGTPREIIDKVHAEIARALTRVEVRKRLETDGADPISMTPAEFSAMIKSEIARWGRVIREAAITAE
jgi:tripartite-type tricarboxylate transporter receptor subunit TctC